LLNTQQVIPALGVLTDGRRAATLGALLLGAHDGQGRLRHLGRVGTRFTETMLDELVRQPQPRLHAPASSDGKPPDPQLSSVGGV
jgi:bifunctional non-homologous end joining protein LigD